MLILCSVGTQTFMGMLRGVPREVGAGSEVGITQAY